MNNKRQLGIESMECRIALDASNVFGVPFEPSEFVRDNENGSVQFASLRVGEVFDFQNPGGAQVLDDTDVVMVAGHELSMGRVKAYLHGFANSIGTDLFIETLDLRNSTWGSGSGSTSQRFEDYMEAEIEAFEPCDGLQFSQAVRFDLPGEGGELFTGGFLDIREDGTGGLLRGGDIVEVVESYDISVNLVRTELTVNAMFGEFAFTVNADKSLTDEFGRVWNPSEDYSIVDPTGVDSVLGDIDANGTVDFADFLILSSEFGSESEQSDLDGSGMVDFADFLILSANYQTVGT